MAHPFFPPGAPAEPPIGHRVSSAPASGPRWWLDATLAWGPSPRRLAPPEVP